MLRLIFAFLCAVAACMLVAGALSSAQSTSSSTPDAFLAQVTRNTRDSFATDISANGRFVVFESNADAATLKPGQTASTKSPTNTDGNSEMFLYDYAQRRVFQLTDTRSVLNPIATPSVSPSPSPSPSVSPSPTATPTATPIDLSNVKIRIENKRPMISAEPALSSGNRTYTIVFSSNAPNPASFDGVDPGPIAGDGGRTLSADANEELWTYQFTVPDAVTLSDGADIAFQDLSAGTFTRITSTPASRAPTAGSTTQAPFIADDNRDATISDDGLAIAFSSTRDLVPGGNVDTGAPAPDPEIFAYSGGTFTQVTNTKSSSNPFIAATFNDYPAISGSGIYTIAFYSNADLTPSASPANPDLNAEVFMAAYNGATISNLKQVTRTKDPADATTGRSLRPANNFVFGRRLSRDGRYIVLESLASDPKANSSTNTDFLVSFVYDGLSDMFAQVGPRAAATPGDVTQYPTFTDYGTGTTPGTVLFASALNFKPDGTFPPSDQDSTGLNPARVSQLFAVSLPSMLPAMLPGPFVRLTNITGTNVFAPLNAAASNSRRRIAFTYGGAELGGGNPDAGAEVFYNLSPPITTESTQSMSLFTGASLIPVASPAASASGSPTPSPSPSASPSGPTIAPGLAAGELAIITSSGPLATATATPMNASDSHFAPELPVELNGVSVSIRGAACGMYMVSPTVISFVVPRGLPASPATGYPLVINILTDSSTSPPTHKVIRGSVVIVAAQPDIFTEPPVAGPGGRAMTCNATAEDNLMGACFATSTFNVTSDNGLGTQVPTIIRVAVTGVRGTAASSASVVVGTTAIVPNKITVSDQPGFDFVYFTLPSTVDRGDIPIVVKVGTASSRPAAEAPHITINP